MAPRTDVWNASSRACLIEGSDWSSSATFVSILTTRAETGEAATHNVSDAAVSHTNVRMGSLLQ